MPYRLGRFGFGLLYEFGGQAYSRTGLRESICHPVRYEAKIVQSHLFSKCVPLHKLECAKINSKFSKKCWPNEKPQNNGKKIVVRSSKHKPKERKINLTMIIVGTDCL